MSNNKHILSTTWRVGTSSSIFGGLTESVLEACIKAGVEYIEVNLIGEWFASRHTDREKYCRMLAQKGDELGIKFWSIHLPFGHEWDISALNEDIRSEIVQRHEALLEYSNIFKTKKAVIHASFEPIPDIEREPRLIACRKTLIQLSKKAEQLGIQVALECLPRTCIGNTIKEIKMLVEDIDLVGICCDTNHNLKDRTEDFICSLGSKIVTLHVSDYDRVDERHWMPGKGVNDWNAIIESLESIGYTGPIMFELRQNIENPIKPADFKECWDRMLNTYLKSK